MVAETNIVAYTDLNGLAGLKARAANDDPRALEAAARQFEALFLQMMLKSMRAAGAGLAEDRDRSYEEMFDQQVAIDLASKDSLGIAEMLMRQVRLGRGAELQAAPLPAVVPETASEFMPEILPGVMPATAAIAPAGETAPPGGGRVDFRPESREAFVSAIWPHAQTVAERLGVDPRAVVAQAALETGWGQKLIRDTRGMSANNLFGIKADQRWHGPSVSVQTVEFHSGRFVPQRASFRAYATLADGFRGYVDFLSQSPRYGDALIHGAEAREFGRRLQEAGFATDPEYGAKIQRILKDPLVASLQEG